VIDEKRSEIATLGAAAATRQVTMTSALAKKTCKPAQHAAAYIPPSLSLSLSPSLPLSLSLFLPLSLFLSLLLFLSLFLLLFIPLPISLSLSLPSFSSSFSISSFISLSLPLSLSSFISLSFPLSNSFSLSYVIYLSLPFSNFFSKCKGAKSDDFGPASLPSRTLSLQCLSGKKATSIPQLKCCEQSEIRNRSLNRHCLMCEW
jgi:hypothetical protein